jgi:hypothetical protein
MVLEKNLILDYYLFCSFVVDEAHVRVWGRNLIKKNNFDNIVFDFVFLFWIPHYYEFCFKFTANMIMVQIWILEHFYLFDMLNT